MNRRMLGAILLLVTTLCVAVSAEPIPDGRYYLFLDEPEPSLDHETVPSFVFCLERNGGRWEPVFSGQGYGIPFGLVRRNRVAGDTAEVDCLVLYFAEGREKKLKGNPEGSFLVEYTLHFRAADAARVAGSWRSSPEMRVRTRASGVSRRRRRAKAS